LNGAGTLTIAGTFIWGEGTQDGGGITNANGTTRLTGVVQLRNRTVNLMGTSFWTFPAVQIDHGQGGVINNSGTAEARVEADVSTNFNQGGARGTINNSGTFGRGVSSGTATFDTTFNNTGTVQANTGTLSFTSSYTQTAGLTRLNGGNLGGGITFNFNGGVLDARGGSTITGNVSNAGATVRPGMSPGTLNIVGNYTQSAGGSLDIELGGTGAGQFDVLAVTGTATLAGTLTATSFGGFTPAVGNSFQVLNFASRSGDFTTNNLIVNGVTLTKTFGATNLTLSAAAAAATADLAVTKTDSADPVNVGQQFTYTVTVTNNGPNAPSDVTLTDTLTGAATFGTITPSQGTCTAPAGGSFTCNLGTIANGANATVTIQVTPQTAAGGTTLSNLASVTSSATDPVPGNNSATQTTAVNSAADLAVTKTDSPDPVPAGQNLTYTVTVTNNGPNSATGVTLTDPLPANTAFVSATAPCVQAAGTVTCNLGTLANGASVTITITVTVTGAAVSPLSNTASVTSTTFDPVAGNNSATASTVITPLADVQITKTAVPNPVNAGQPLTYTVTVVNNGPNAATGVTVTDTPPATLTLVSAVGSQGTCTITAGTITCAVGTLASGAQATATIVVTPQAGAVPSVSNTATVTATQTDPTPANNSSTVVVTVNPSANLVITKTDSPDPVLFGQNLTYTVTVVNNGPNTATGVTLTDTLPASVTFVSSTPAAPTCSRSGVTLTCNLGSLASGANTIVTIAVTAPNTAGSITNTATVTAAEFDPSTPNTASATTTVNSPVQPDFSMSATPAALSVPAGLDAIYTISVAQLGGLAGQVALTCSGNPELSTCTIAPASVGLGAQPATATATISTRASGTVPPVAPQPPLGTLRVVLAMLFGMLALAMLAGMARAARQRTWRGALVRLAALVVWSTLAWGCVSSSTGTPPGTYTITFTGQQGSITHSTQVTLVVR